MDPVPARNSFAPTTLTPQRHENHILLHVNEMIAMHKQDRLLKVLDDCMLQCQVGGRISRKDGEPVTSDDCRAYLRAVRRFAGYVDYLLARIALAQAGCSTLHHWKTKIEKGA
jgi:hypothetical protein